MKKKIFRTASLTILLMYFAVILALTSTLQLTAQTPTSTPDVAMRVEQTLAAGATATVQARANATAVSAIWVWNDSVIFNSETVINQLAVSGFNRVYLHVYNELTQNPDRIADFIRDAAARGIATEFLAGDAAWSLADFYQEALAFVDETLVFSLTRPGGAPVAIHLDIEPHVLDTWNPAPDSPENHAIAHQYLDLLREVRTRLDARNAGLLLNVDAPFWYDRITFTYEGVSQTFVEHILRYVDGVTVMAYRDIVDGSDGVFALSQFELDAASTVNRRVVIGLETNPVEPPKITFCQEGGQALAATRQAIIGQWTGHSAFAGTAVHDYLGFLSVDACVGQAAVASAPTATLAPTMTPPPPAATIAPVVTLVPAQNPCTTNLYSCTNIHTIMINGQAIPNGGTLDLAPGDPINIESIAYSLSAENLAIIHQTFGGVSYAYGYAFPVIEGVPENQWELKSYASPRNNAKNPMFAGDGTFLIQNVRAIPAWTCEPGWQRIHVLVMHHVLNDPNPDAESPIGIAVVNLDC